MAIPKLLHRIWFGEPIPDEYLGYLTSLVTINPDYEVMLWVDSLSISDSYFKTIQTFCEKNNITLCDIRYENSLENIGLIASELSKAKRSETHKRLFYVRASDIARMSILLAYGGVYSDTDSKPLQPFQSLDAKYGVLFKYINKSDANFYSVNEPGYQYYFPSMLYDFIAAEPGHIVLETTCEILQLDFETYSTSAHREWELSNHGSDLFLGTGALTGVSLTYALNYLYQSKKLTIDEPEKLFFDSQKIMPSFYHKEKTWLQGFRMTALSYHVPNSKSVFAFATQIDDCRSQHFPTTMHGDSRSEYEKRKEMKNISDDSDQYLDEFNGIEQTADENKGEQSAYTPVSTATGWKSRPTAPRIIDIVWLNRIKPPANPLSLFVVDLDTMKKELNEATSRILSEFKSSIPTAQVQLITVTLDQYETHKKMLMGQKILYVPNSDKRDETNYTHLFSISIKSTKENLNKAILAIDDFFINSTIVYEFPKISISLVKYNDASPQNSDEICIAVENNFSYTTDQYKKLILALWNLLELFDVNVSNMTPNPSAKELKTENTIITPVTYMSQDTASSTTPLSDIFITKNDIKNSSIRSSNALVACAMRILMMRMAAKKPDEQNTSSLGQESVRFHELYLGSTFSPEYDKLWNESNGSLFENVKAILLDYTKNDSTIKRLFTFHWNRHHVSEVTHALSSLPDDKTDEEKLDLLLDSLGKITLNNSDGTLGSRIAYIVAKLNLNSAKTQTISHTLPSGPS